MTHDPGTGILERTGVVPMPTALRRSEPVTIEAFDTFVEAQADIALFELVEGDIVMMTNPTEVHEQIASNIAAPLKLAMDPRGCRTYQGGMRMQRSDDARDTDKTRPDVVVRCGAVGSGNYITDPLVVVEVLSPSTMDIDRGPKLDFCKSLPTIRHIALVYQDQMRVEHYRRGEQGLELEVLKRPDEALHFEAVEFRIELARVYFDVAV
jgi:Uma2 family endonuclease